MKDISIILTGDRIEISDYNTRFIKDKVKEHGSPIRAHIVLSLPESRKARSYCMGCLIPLIVYMDNNDWRDSELCDRYFQFLKREISPEAIKINGKVELFGRSTKGAKSLQNFSSKLQDYLNEQYAISYDSKATNVEEYKRFKDELFSTGEWEDYISYCEAMKWIDKNKEI